MPDSVTGSIELTNTGAAISARGRLLATAILPCSRCLAEHEVPLDFEVHEECRLAQIDEPAPPGEEESEQIPILDGDLVDLTELIRQTVALNIPPGSVCRADCAGLCAQCGANLNEGECRCAQKAADPRWAGLESLVLDDDEGQ